MKSFALLFVTLVVLSAMANAQDELISTLAPAPAPAMENGSDYFWTDLWCLIVSLVLYTFEAYEFESITKNCV
ncbi:hypothetical protein FCM35_KLT15631 [Carex littledalei]|uniref:Uncharacterized protein n=1 Tax=Carex littledalei TaxID=544730 RepID=A0A833R0B6_9POAL|nr:hypothetical protein FCM35_KLT15631 [Carex littledalei]